MTTATCDDNPFDGRIAHQAGLTLAAIDPVLQLEEPFAPVDVNIVADRGAAEFDRLT